MAIPRVERHPTALTWSASGSISLELSPKPFTITRMALIVRPTITTASATNFNDYWDRLISRLNLTGGGKTFFDFSNLRAPYHMSRFAGFGPKRPTVYADGSTTQVQQFAYVFHFGVAPKKVNAAGMLVDNPFDLTGGIEPVSAGNLSLGGTFGAATAAGTNVTVTAATVDVYLYGVQPEAGDPAALYLPQAFPQWTMETPTPTATSSAFATAHNIPSGEFLHSLLVMQTNGTNSPRDDSVLNSIRLQNQQEARTIISYGGQSGVALDYKAAEILSQFEHSGWVPTDNVSTAMTALTGTAGVPEITAPSDSGLVWMDLTKHLRSGKGHPLYGADMRHLATGDLRLEYGVSDATGVTLDVLYRKYQLNRAHPASAAYPG